MVAYAPAVLLFLAFCWGVVRERRRLSNGVLLGLACVFALTAWLFELSEADPVLGRDIRIGLLVLTALGIVALSLFLISNGVTMVRKEGRSPANLLSLLAGIALVGLAALLVTAYVLHTRTLLAVAATVAALAGYLGFLFLCFLGYAFIYGRLNLRRKADYVVVLGSGLIGGTTVPPLLAGRLDRALTLHRRLSVKGRRPVLLVSGGQGPDEKLPESHAMADYLKAAGVPPELVEREDRSTTTEQNLRFSREIMERAKPDYRCVVVTNNYHAFRAAVTSRRAGVRGHVVGAPTARYFWPSAMIREYVALLLDYRRTNLAVCLLLVIGGVLIWWLS